MKKPLSSEERIVLLDTVSGFGKETLSTTKASDEVFIGTTLITKTLLVVYDKESGASLEFLRLASFLTGKTYEPLRMSFLARLRRIFSRLS